MEFLYGLVRRHIGTIMVTIIYFLFWVRLWWVEQHIPLDGNGGDRIAMGEGIMYGYLLAVLFALFLTFAFLIKLWFKRDILFCLMSLVVIWMPVAYMIWRSSS